MTQPGRCSCVVMRFLLIAVTLAVTASLPGDVLRAQAGGGLNHSLFLKSDGTVWAVGANVSGQLGDNTTTTRKSPIPTSNLSDVVAVAAGRSHSLAVTSTGALYVWGENGSGQVGDASTTDRKLPVQSNLTNVVAVAAGMDHSVALKSNGDVYVWGRDNKGQLGDGTAGATNTLTPALLTTGAAAIAAGADFTLVVKTDGTVYATGENSDYQLGDGTTTDRSSLVQMSGVTTAIAAAAGERHSLILLSGGTVKGVGFNGYGNLGDGSTTTRSSVVTVGSLSNITAIASGMNHALARESDGSLWSWGINNVGQIGNDNAPTNAASPVELTSLSSIATIGAGESHAIAITSSGIVYTWGANGNYQLGDGTNVDRHVPTPISDSGFDWKVSTPTFNVAAGQYTVNKTVTISITTSGATIRYTQNGNEPTESDSSIASGSSVTVSTSQTLKAKAFKSGMPASNTNAAAYELKVATPTTSPTGGTFTSAQSVTMSTTSSGATLRYTTDGSTPTESSAAYASAITVGTSTALKVLGFKSGWTTSDLRTSTFTMNFGTLSTPTADTGTGSYTNSVTVALSALSGATIRYTTNNTAVQPTSAIYSAPLAFDTTTTLRVKAYHPDYTASSEATFTYTLAAATPTFNPTAGTYVAGQLVTVTSPSVGSTVHYTINGAEPTESDPTIASGATLVVGNYTLKAKAWKAGANASATASAVYTVTGEVTPPAIAAGYDHSLAIRSDGVGWGWGYNNFGQAGDGTQTQRTLPRIMTGLTGAAAARGGEMHSHVLLNDGTLRGVGSGTNGRLGDGGTSVQLLPVSVSLTAVVSMDDGKAHAIALTGDGSVFTWGLNGQGQIGDGTTTQRLSPTAITSLTSIVAVAAGEEFSLALEQDGTIHSWGRNDEGALGDGTTTDRTAPVEVDDITTAVAIAAGHQHALALLADGSVAAWGDNAYGALGDGTTTGATTPGAVAGLEGVIAIGAGNRFSVALTDDGHVWSWGYNGYGALGDGTTTDRWSPAQISGLSDIVQIAVGANHVLAMDSTGIVYAWGNNDRGQLGDGTTTARLTPVAISGTGMNWRVATPTLSLASGLYSTDQSVTVTIAEPEATIRYTTTGVDPTSSDATVTSGNAISVTQSQTLKVSGWKSGAPTSVVVARQYELKAVTPSLTPGSGAYGSTQSVSISTSTSGATIRYTTDGTEPTFSSSVYSTALSVALTQTVKARAYKTGWTSSESNHASYWLSEGTVATPTMSPSGGTQTSPPLVAITTSTSGATIRFTLDGSTPTGSSPVFVYPFLVNATTTVKAKAFKAGLTASGVASTTYDVDAAGATATPLMAPTGGLFATAQTVTITGASGATLRYTTDGTDPTTSSTSITSGNTVTVSKSQVLKVRAWASGLTASAVRRADFMITGAVAAGETHSMALDSSGGAWTWGGDGFGQLGNGAGASTVTTPAQVLSSVVAIAAGARNALAAKADGSLWRWGDGSGTSPAQVSGVTNVIAVASGYGHSLFLKADGSVWAYGVNTYGELGDGTTTYRSTPVQVVGLSGVVAIAANREASYALQTDGGTTGILWAWGRNQYGQLGEGSTQSRLTPVRVLGVTNPTHIAASSLGDFGIALQANGEIVAWGRNNEGQLGLGTTTDGSSATAVSVIARARVIGAGSEHAMAIDAAARAWGWGDTRWTGMAAAATGSVPQASDLGAALAIAGGDTHTLAVRPDGSVAAFGANGGRLGNGSTAGTNEIVTVSSLELADNDWLMTDADSDSLVTWREYLAGTDPLNPDSNGNGILDGLDERSGIDALDPDVDGDGVPNWIEQLNGTDPFRADTDGDTVPDGSDVYPLDPTRSMAPSSNPSDTTPPVITLKEPVSAVPIP
ncbi:MAG: chitobiase/beta-hexosaminidase C-terminal domain-containing protein [Cyanobacteria bacterium]|nr:chitobiase/beta-hexosaminidase C-terminal domain-containing protein [Cyanobacteriota bacterium]